MTNDPCENVPGDDEPVGGSNSKGSTIIKCSVCSKEGKARAKKDGEPALPKGWKKDLDGNIFCSDCWEQKYVIRACIMVVAENVEEAIADPKERKDAMWDAAREAWSEATEVSNAVVQILWRNDVLRTADMEKLPPMPKINLYGAANSVNNMDSGNYSSLVHSIEQKYREMRYKTLWKREARPPCYKWPQPYPVRKDCWQVFRHDTGGHPMIRIKFRRKWWQLRLRGGPTFRRQLQQFDQIISKQALPVDAAFYRSKDEKGYKLMIKMVAWFPRPAKRDHPNGTMELVTSGDRFITATIGHTTPWYLNCDHVRRWIAEHERFRQRLAEDLKFEKRFPQEQREGMLRSLSAKCDKQHARLNNFIHTVTKQIAGYADRQGANCVRLDMTDQSYFPSFEWSAFYMELERKLNDAGIMFINAADEKEAA